MRGDPADPLTAAWSLTVWVTYEISMYGRIGDYLFVTAGWLRLWKFYLTLWEATGGLFDTM